jgi:hypothetical protein
LRATRRALRAGSDVATPRIRVRRDGARAVVRYRLTGAAPATLLVSVARAGEPDRATARRVRVRGRAGVVTLRLPSGGPYIVTASAFGERGARSGTVRAPVR